MDHIYLLKTIFAPFPLQQGFVTTVKEGMAVVKDFLINNWGIRDSQIIDIVPNKEESISATYNFEGTDTEIVFYLIKVKRAKI